MDTLEMYKRLSNEDKANLTIYCIYESIYSVANRWRIELDDKVVKRIQEEAYHIYLDDDFFNFSCERISDFITDCYFEDNSFLDKLEDIDLSDLLQAIDEQNFEFYKDEEMER